MTKHNKTKNILANPTIKKWVNWRIMTLLLGGVLYGSSGFANETDYLTKLKPIMKTNLGIGSVVVSCIYLVAIYLSIRHFLETKNPTAFIAVVVVVAFLNFALPTLVFTS